MNNLKIRKKHRMFNYIFLSIFGVLFLFNPGKGIAEISNIDMASEDEVAKARRAIITVETLDQMTGLPGEIGELPDVSAPAGNPQTPEKIALGKMLFFEKRLSFDRVSSCATCHDPAKGFADGKARAIGFGGKELGRNSPTIVNVAYNDSFFWDGRSPTMEDQAQKPIESNVEMNMSSKEVAKRLNTIPEYKKRFAEVFHQPANLGDVGKAIAAFERTLLASRSKFDQYIHGDKNALTVQEKKGLILFVSKAACTQCHRGANFTDNQFHVLGVPQKGPREEDLGRFEVTRVSADKMAFKTPTLRNIVLTGPYMHDGAFETLEEVVDFYNQGGGTLPGKSPKILKLHLTSQEKKDLVAFLKTLTGQVPVVAVPDLPINP